MSDQGSLISVNNASLDQALAVHCQIPEFPDPSYVIDRFDERTRGSQDVLIMTADYQDQPAGYLIGYNESSTVFYCWMAWVIPEFRRDGVLTEMMDHQIVWARERNYNRLRIKIRNEFRNMLLFLVNQDFDFVDVLRENDDIKWWGIVAEKEL